MPVIYKISIESTVDNKNSFYDFIYNCYIDFLMLSSLYTWFAKYYKLRWIYWIPTLGARVRILLKPVVRLGDLHPL